jgi:uncharacterized protein (DUF58 family)
MNTTSLSYIATLLTGFGVAELQLDFNRALIAFGLAVVLVITSAVLNAKGIPVSKTQ